jgi:hypothetical protein
LRASVGSTEAAKDVVARVGRIDRSTLGSMDFGAVRPERATSRSAVEPSGEVGPTSRRRLARHNI